MSRSCKLPCPCFDLQRVYISRSCKLPCPCFDLQRVYISRSCKLPCPCFDLQRVYISRSCKLPCPCFDLQRVYISRSCKLPCPCFGLLRGIMVLHARCGKHYTSETCLQLRSRPRSYHPKRNLKPSEDMWRIENPVINGRLTVMTKVSRPCLGFPGSTAPCLFSSCVCGRRLLAGCPWLRMCVRIMAV